jgi:aquaporin Z
MDERVRIMVAEATGTAVLVTGGCGTAIFAAGAIQGRGFGGVGVFGVATAFGLSLLVMAYAIGHISGCHINPAVSLGMVLGGKLKPALLPYYWLAQFAGGLGAGLMLRVIVKAGKTPIASSNFASNGYDAGSPLGFHLSAVALTEVVMTAILVFVILSTTHPRFPAGFGGIAAGVTLWLVHLISIPISNTSVNPARSLAVAPFAPISRPLHQVWAFIVFPLIGGIVGAIVFRVVNLEGAGAAAVPDVEGTLKEGAVVEAPAEA